MVQRVLSLIVMTVLAAGAAHAATPLQTFTRFLESAGDSLVRSTAPHAPRLPANEVLAHVPLPNLRPGEASATADETATAADGDVPLPRRLRTQRKRRHSRSPWKPRAQRLSRSRAACRHSQGIARPAGTAARRSTTALASGHAFAARGCARPVRAPSEPNPPPTRTHRFRPTIRVRRPVATLTAVAPPPAATTAAPVKPAVAPAAAPKPTPAALPTSGAGSKPSGPVGVDHLVRRRARRLRREGGAGNGPR